MTGKITVVTDDGRVLASYGGIPADYLERAVRILRLVFGPLSLIADVKRRMVGALEGVEKRNAAAAGRRRRT